MNMSSGEINRGPTGWQLQIPGSTLIESGLTVVETLSGLTVAALFDWEMRVDGPSDFVRTFGHHLIIASVARATGAFVFERHASQKNETASGTISGPYPCQMGVCAVTEQTARGAAHLSGTYMRTVPEHELSDFWAGFEGSDQAAEWNKLRHASPENDVFGPQNADLRFAALGVAACHSLRGLPAQEAFEAARTGRLELSEGATPPSIADRVPPAVTA